MRLTFFSAGAVGFVAAFVAVWVLLGVIASGDPSVRAERQSGSDAPSSGSPHDELRLRSYVQGLESSLEREYGALMAPQPSVTPAAGQPRPFRDVVEAALVDVPGAELLDVDCTVYPCMGLFVVPRPAADIAIDPLKAELEVRLNELGHDALVAGGHNHMFDDALGVDHRSFTVTIIPDALPTKEQERMLDSRRVLMEADASGLLRRRVAQQVGR